jgi:hypothetical protein
MFRSLCASFSCEVSHCLGGDAAPSVLKIRSFAGMPRPLFGYVPSVPCIQIFVLLQLWIPLRCYGEVRIRILGGSACSTPTTPFSKTESTVLGRSPANLLNESKNYSARWICLLLAIAALQYWYALDSAAKHDKFSNFCRTSLVHPPIHIAPSVPRTS